MNNKKISRRRLLATTGALGVITVQVPSKWSKPIVDTVILPAHAQTSANCQPLVIPGTTISCSLPATPATEIITRYTFSFVNGCLTYQAEASDDQGLVGGLVPVITLTDSNVLIISELRDRWVEDRTTIMMVTSTGFSIMFQDCFDPAEPTTNETLALTIEGVPCTASFTLSSNSGTEATVSDIVIAPA